MANLLLYGSQNLSSNKSLTSAKDGSRGMNIVVDRLPNTRSAGSTVVNKKIAERVITLSGVLQSQGSLGLTDVIDEYKKAFAENDRYFRVSTNWQDIFNFESATGWSASNDATNISTSDSNYQYGTKSVTFDIDVSASANDYATITNSSLTSKDLSGVSGTGNIEFWMYLPSQVYVSTVTLRFGNDASNYYSFDFSQQYDGTDLQSGWNYFSNAWSSFTETGTVNDGALDYCVFEVAYSSSQADMAGLAVSGLLWQLDTNSRNYRCYSEGISANDLSYNIGYTEFQARLLNYDGVSRATNTDLVLDVNSTSGTQSFTVDFGGTAEQFPNISIDYTTASNLDTIELENLTNNSSVVLDVGTVSGDILNIDTKSKQVNKTGTIVDYNYVLPEFEAGINILKLTHLSNSPQVISQSNSDSSFIPTGEEGICVSFVPTVNSTVIAATINAKINYIGPNSFRNIGVRIYSDSASTVVFPVVASGFFRVTIDDTTYKSFPVTFTSSNQLVAGTRYWLSFFQYSSSFFNPLSIDYQRLSTPSPAPNIRKINSYTDPSVGQASYSGDMVYSITLNPVLTIDYDISITNNKLYL